MKVCKICKRNPCPTGKDVCWVCDHTKLHPTDKKPVAIYYSDDKKHSGLYEEEA